MMNILHNEIITFITGNLEYFLTGGFLTSLCLWRVNKRKAKAEADRSLIENYELRLSGTHKTIRYLNRSNSK